MGDVVNLPLRSDKPEPFCVECGKTFPKLTTLSMSIAPSDLGDFKVTGASLNVICPCGAHYTLSRRTK